MREIDLSGIFPPIPTPFVREEVAYEQLASNVEKWAGTGIRGLVVLGSNGEYVSLSEEEKREVVKTVLGAAPEGMPIIVGSGCEGTRETIRLTEDLAALGAHAGLVVSPHYYAGRMDEKALLRHYEKLAEEAPIPILLYNVPKFTHINLGADLVAALSRHPNIIGIKDSSGNVNQLGQYLNRVDRDFDVLVGTAGALFGALALGCSGGILGLANVAPEACVQIFRLVRDGQWEEARRLQLKMLPVNNAVTLIYGVSGLKYALDKLGYFGGDPRLPLLPLNEEEKAAIDEILVQAELL